MGASSLCACLVQGVQPQRRTRQLQSRKSVGCRVYWSLTHNPDAADSLGFVLQLLGADVHVAHDGNAALDAVASFHPMAVFLDIGMPDMDGYEVAKKIRARPDAHHTVLIALTGRGQEKDRRQTEASGFKHHLVKPAGVGDLQAVLASLAR